MLSSINPKRYLVFVLSVVLCLGQSYSIIQTRWLIQDDRVTSTYCEWNIDNKDAEAEAESI